MALTNAGPHTAGVVSFEGSSYTISYSVELPAGTRKRLVVYLPTTAILYGFGDAKLVLSTPRGSVSHTIEPDYGERSSSVALVADTAGVAGFLNRKGAVNAEERSAGMRAVYGTPGRLPDRPSGYLGLGALVLGAGSERMRDEEVRAVQTWLATGGCVVFIGGASSPVLSDPRWRNVLPVTNLRRATRYAAAGLGQLGGTAPENAPVTLTLGDPRPGAEALPNSRAPLLVSRTVGLGRAVYLAFNPFDPPLNVWKGRYEVFRLHVLDDDASESTGLLLGHNSTAMYGEEMSPFQVTLPTLGQMFGLLCLYIVIVVPVNYFVLRKLRRGELAWVTGPFISLVFAAVFFTFAMPLYSLPLATASRGVLVVDPSVGEGYYSGSVQVFFPHGGTYDLNLHNVDGLWSQALGRRNPYDYSGPGWNSIDVGQVLVPRLAVTNLSFREMWIGQIVHAAGWIDGRVRVRPASDGRLRLSDWVENRSPYPIRGAAVLAGKDVFEIGDIAPGSKIEVRQAMLPVRQVATGEKQLPGYNTYYDPETAIAQRSGPLRPALFANLGGFRPGPNIGRPAPGFEEDRLAYFFADYQVAR